MKACFHDLSRMQWHSSNITTTASRCVNLFTSATRSMVCRVSTLAPYYRPSTVWMLFTFRYFSHGTNMSVQIASFRICLLIKIVSSEAYDVYKRYTAVFYYPSTAVLFHVCLLQRRAQAQQHIKRLLFEKAVGIKNDPKNGMKPP